MIINFCSHECFNELRGGSTFKMRLSSSVADEEPFKERNNVLRH